MYSIQLPISKSIANRLLLLQALQGKFDCALQLDNAADDIRLLHGILTDYHNISPSTPIIFNCHNCGTAIRFLTAFFAATEGANVTLTGSQRMLQRPIGQLVEALQSLGANITYLGQEGFPPLHIVGQKLQGGEIHLPKPQSTQFVSALMLISQVTEKGISVYTEQSSPYIDMTKQLIQQTQSQHPCTLELDWSAAAFWYEYIAIHGGEMYFPQLYKSTLQGDSRVAEIYHKHFGVSTTYTPNGVIIQKNQPITHDAVHLDFTACPDLYPAIRMTCHALHIPLQATGTERLPLKESDRLQAFEQLHDTSRKVYTAYDDHRIAMALMAAGLEVDDTDCVSKSYPQFVSQLTALRAEGITIIIPFRNIARQPFPTLPCHLPIILIDDHSTDDSVRLLQTHYAPQSNISISSSPYQQGKKQALRYGMEQALTRYVWTMDFDISLPDLSITQPLTADLYILPLRMQQEGHLLNQLQVTEYATLQALTLWTAEKHKPVMCSGANLIVKRSEWLLSYDALHTDIPSGDDMFLLEDFKRRGLNILPLYNIALIQPQPTWQQLLRQRMRWAGKAPAYTDKHIRRCGALVVCLNLLSICPLLWLIKFACEYCLLHQAKRYNLIQFYPQQFLITLFLSLLYPWYMLICLIGGLFRRKQW